MTTKVAASRFIRLARLGCRLGVNGCVDLVFPPRCTLCAVDLPESADRILLCAGCRKEIVSHQPACPRCACHVATIKLDGCVQCRDAKLRFDAAVRLGDYQETLRRAILRTKQSNEQALAKSLADVLAACRSDELQRLNVDVVPIPMHWRRRLLR